jgi:hypothetical protein
MVVITMESFSFSSLIEAQTDGSNYHGIINGKP